MGKTVTTEFALFEPGPTTNPLDVTRMPGGSSSGSAAATADRMVAVALGTQTAGSVIRPASFCGVLGFKPSFGAIDRGGLHVISPSLDTLGIFARSVRDIELVFQSVRSTPPSQSRPIRRDRQPRLGFVRTSDWGRADPSTANELEALVGSLVALGFDIVELTLPSSFAAMVSMQVAIMEREVGHTLSDHLAQHGDLMIASTRKLIRRGTGQLEE